MEDLLLGIAEEGLAALLTALAFAGLALVAPRPGDAAASGRTSGLGAEQEAADERTVQALTLLFLPAWVPATWGMYRVLTGFSVWWHTVPGATEHLVLCVWVFRLLPALLLGLFLALGLVTLGARIRFGAARFRHLQEASWRIGDAMYGFDSRRAERWSAVFLLLMAAGSYAVDLRSATRLSATEFVVRDLFEGDLTAPRARVRRVVRYLPDARREGSEFTYVVELADGRTWDASMHVMTVPDPDLITAMDALAATSMEGRVVEGRREEGRDPEEEAAGGGDDP